MGIPVLNPDNLLLPVIGCEKLSEEKLFDPNEKLSEDKLLDTFSDDKLSEDKLFDLFDSFDKLLN